MDYVTSEMFKAIDNLVDASREEKDALKDIFHVEGFGGREDYLGADDRDYRDLAKNRLVWLRGQRAEGLR